jgi:hypothetical protein
MDAMRTLLVALLLGLGLAFGSLTPTAAHQAPCEDELGPGHSEYAQHHIVPHAKAGELGDGGHKPGEHRGYAGLCGD